MPAWIRHSTCLGSLLGIGISVPGQNCSLCVAPARERDREGAVGRQRHRLIEQVNSLFGAVRRGNRARGSARNDDFRSSETARFRYAVCVRSVRQGCVAEPRGEHHRPRDPAGSVRRLRFRRSCHPIDDGLPPHRQAARSRAHGQRHGLLDPSGNSVPRAAVLPRQQRQAPAGRITRAHEQVLQRATLPSPSAKQLLSRSPCVRNGTMTSVGMVTERYGADDGSSRRRIAGSARAAPRAGGSPKAAHRNSVR